MTTIDVTLHWLEEQLETRRAETQRRRGRWRTKSLEEAVRLSHAISLIRRAYRPSAIDNLFVGKAGDA